MKVLVYSVNAVEKKYLLAANKNRHELDFCIESLNKKTAPLAEHFDVVMVTDIDPVSSAVIKKLKDVNVRFIAIRGRNYGQVDIDAARAVGIHVANIPEPEKRPLFVKDQLSHMAAASFYNIDCWAKNNTSRNELVNPKAGYRKKEKLLQQS